MAVDMFNVTEKGRRALTVIHKYEKPMHLSEVVLKRDSDAEQLEELHLFELLQRLRQQGWECKSQKSKVKVDPYMTGSPKIFWHTTAAVRGNLSPVYLISLLRADELLASGLAGLHRMQVRKYYEAALGLQPCDLQKLLPGQPGSFYELLLRPKKTRATEPSAAAASLEMEEERGGRGV